MSKALKYFRGDELAAKVWLDKYAYNGELSPDEMHMRMAEEFGRIEFEKVLDEREYVTSDQIQALSSYGEDRLLLNDEEMPEHQLQTYLVNKCYGLFHNFKYIVPQGSIMSTLGTDIIASLSNCWVEESPLDSYASILRTDANLAFYYKRRGGVGIDLSNLRPKGTATNNTAKTTTGVVSFMPRFSNTTREVAMDGRRGALMLSIDINHPDSMDFIKSKRDGVSITGANISVKLNDEFMKAVKNDEDYILRFPVDASIPEDDWDLIMEYDKLEEFMSGDEKDKFVFFKKIRAREYWNEIVKSATKHAEPGIMYWDNVLNYDPAAVYEQYKPISSNPCVTGDTEVITKFGYVPIETLVNVPVEIWNGYEWSTVTPKITGYNQKMFTVELSDGRSLTATDYHKWILKGNKRVKTIELKIGDKIEKYNFPILKDSFTLAHNKEAYTQGFISADGQDGYNHLWLYEPKYMCEKRLDVKSSNEFEGKKQVFFNNVYKEKSFVPLDSALQIKLEWLSGLFDGDGTELKEGGLQLWSIDKNFLLELQKLLSLLGVNSKVVDGKKECSKEMPDGKGGTAEYDCKECFRICLGATEIQDLKKLGLNCSRMNFDKTPNRSAQRFVTITKITEASIADKVYCFNDALNNSGVFNGILTANCGEQFLNANDSCRLMALNLYSFVNEPFTDESEIDFEKLYEVCYEHARMGDNLIDLELEYIQKIIDKIKSDPEPYSIKEAEYDLWETSYKNTKAGRRIGLGITALADMLAAINVQYGSEESLEVIEKVMRTKMEAELDCTIDLSILRGTFEGWDATLEFGSCVSGELVGANSFYQMIVDKFPKQAHKMIEYGRRNVSWSTIAPTGSVSLLTQSSSGCEPLFAPYHIRRTKINPSEVGAKVDFIDENGDKWQEFPVLHEKFKDWLKITYEVNDSAIEGLNKELLDIHFKNSPWYGAIANDVPWSRRNEIQAMLQKYTTNAISSTINLHKGTSEEIVSNIYMSGWKLGLKGQTVYVDGSRDGVLINDDNKSSKLKHTTAPKRPKDLICETHSTKSNGIKYNVFVGLLDGEPYEIFLTEYFTNEPTLVLKKIKKGRYDLYKGKEVYSEDISSNMTDEQEAITRLVSTSLRHGAEIKFVVEQLQKTSSEDMFSFTKGLARVLKKYIPNGATSTVVCSECGSTEVIFEEGCNKCLSCGHSACS